MQGRYNTSILVKRNWRDQSMETQQLSFSNEHLATLLEQAHKKGSEEELTAAQMVSWLAQQLKK